MARQRFGYGRWSAPFWFIGSEEGGRDDLLNRASVWRAMGMPDVCDCKEFHSRINIFKHFLPAPGPPLVPTWARLITLLLSYCNQRSDVIAIKDYQREKWGRKNGETCVVELSGLPAANVKLAALQAVKNFSNGKFEEVLNQRIGYISARLQENRPKLVVMYSKSYWQHFKRIVPGILDDERLEGCDVATGRFGDTIYALTPAPAARGIPKSYWIKLGEKLSHL